MDLTYSRFNPDTVSSNVYTTCSLSVTSPGAQLTQAATKPAIYLNPSQDLYSLPSQAVTYDEASSTTISLENAIRIANGCENSHSPPCRPQFSHNSPIQADNIDCMNSRTVCMNFDFSSGFLPGQTSECTVSSSR